MTRSYLSYTGFCVACNIKMQLRASLLVEWAGDVHYLPRLRVGRIVLSLAQWRLSQMEVEAISKEEGSRRFVAVQELRKKRTAALDCISGRR